MHGNINQVHHNVALAGFMVHSAMGILQVLFVHFHCKCACQANILAQLYITKTTAANLLQTQVRHDCQQCKCKGGSRTCDCHTWSKTWVFWLTLKEEAHGYSTYAIHCMCTYTFHDLCIWVHAHIMLGKSKERHILQKNPYDTMHLSILM